MTSRIVVALAGLLLLGSVQASDRIMPGLTAKWIAKDMVINGVPASMQSIEGRVRLDDVLRYYRNAWEGRLDERVEGNWRVLATRDRRQFVSLRLRSGGPGVEGVLTVSLDPSLATPNVASELLVPAGLVRLAHQSFRDPGVDGENLTLMSHRSVAYERQAFESLYRSDGWSSIENRATQSVYDGRVMQFLRGKQQVRVVLYRDPALANGNTLILVSSQRQ